MAADEEREREKKAIIQLGVGMQARDFALFGVRLATFVRVCRPPHLHLTGRRYQRVQYALSHAHSSALTRATC